MLSIIIPCHNEESSIGNVIRALHYIKIPKEIIVVDNGSTDRTRETAREGGATVIHEGRQGYGYALKAGFAHARGEVIATLDGDEQYPAEKLEELVHELTGKNLDFISAARFPLRNKHSLSWTRRFGNKLLTFAGNLIFGLKLKDSQSGMMIFKRKVLEQFKLESNGMALSEEIKIKAVTDKSLRFEECNIPYHPRSGVSKLFPIRHGIENILFLFKLKRDRATGGNLGFPQNKPDPVLAKILLGFVLIIYLVLSFHNISAPFNHMNEDTDAAHGIAIQNLMRYGFSPLKFGMHDYWIRNLDPANPGSLNTHHPDAFIIPTLMFYKLFGASEATTRMGPLSLMVLAMIFLFCALIKIFENLFVPFVSLLILAILPGMVFFGKHLDMQTPLLALALITYSLFIFALTTKKKWVTYVFLASLPIGGLMGWHYYFILPAIHLIALFDKKTPHRKTLLILMPIAAIFPAVLTFAQFYWISGREAIESLFTALKGRTQPDLMIASRRGRLADFFALNFTPLFLALGALGCARTVVNISREKKLWLLAPLALMPISIFFIFQQWTITHAFGTTYFLPIVAIMSAMAIAGIYRTFRTLGVIIAVIVLLAGLYFSNKNLHAYYDTQLSLSASDLTILRELGRQVHDDEICIGADRNAFNYQAIAEWYMRKTLVPSNLCFEKGGIKGAIVLRPQFGPEYVSEISRFVKAGFAMRNCAGYFCYMDRVKIKK